MMIDLLLYRRVNFKFGLLDCDCYIRDIMIPWIVKLGFCSMHSTVSNTGRAEKCLTLYREYSYIEDHYIGVAL